MVEISNFIKEQLKYRIPIIRPFSDEEAKAAPHAMAALFYEEGRPEKTIIALGTDNIEDTISSLWHEEMHNLMFQMFDFTEQAEEINTLLDNTFNLNEKGEIDWSKKPKGSIMHEMQFWLFGKHKDLSRKHKQILESWKD